MSDAKPFQTERTRYLQTCELDKREQKAVDDIETFGCYIIQVRPTSHGLGWSYTLGIHDTSGQPEVIVVGLKNDGAAMGLLNEAARQLRAGVDLTAVPQDDMLGNVQCIFRPVDPKWVQHLMGWSKWFNDTWDFPVLQAIYPDLKNRFQAIGDAPGHPDFTEYFRQPLLQPGVIMTRTEDDFWASADPKSSLFDWKFPDPPHTLVLVTNEVNDGREDVTFVNHLPDDEGWEFVGDKEGDDFSMVCLHHPIDADPSLKELADLPKGWNAVRSEKGADWLRRPMRLDD